VVPVERDDDEDEDDDLLPRGLRTPTLLLDDFDLEVGGVLTDGLGDLEEYEDVEQIDGVGERSSDDVDDSPLA
jgi:hypothetical protein